MDSMDRTDGRIGLVLGAGGGAGANWIRGVLDALAETVGFAPEHASTLIGTSIGAIKAAGIGPHSPPPALVVERLARVDASLPPAGSISRVLSTLRLGGGRAVALLGRAGPADPLTWVEHIQRDTPAQICSMRRFPPTRRATTLRTSPDPAREIAASAAIPFGAQRVQIGGAAHVDGAVWSVSNADLASPEELDVLVVIAPLVARDGGSVLSMLARHQLAVELAPWHRAGKPALVFAPTGEQYKTRQDRARHRHDGRTTALAAVRGSIGNETSG